MTDQSVEPDISIFVLILVEFCNIIVGMVSSKLDIPMERGHGTECSRGKLVGVNAAYGRGPNRNLLSPQYSSSRQIRDRTVDLVHPAIAISLNSTLFCPIRETVRVDQLNTTERISLHDGLSRLKRDMCFFLLRKPATRQERQPTWPYVHAMTWTRSSEI